MPSEPDYLGASLEKRFRTDIEPLLSEFCFGCHSEKRSKAGVSFEGLHNVFDMLAIEGDFWAARELINSHDMPPPDEPSPTDHQRQLINEWIDDVLSYYPADAEIDPGWFTIHRLNRSEYTNTLRDLLYLDDAHKVTGQLPPDDTGYGFDNIADVLSTSTLQVEQYLEAAERAIELALGPVVEVGAGPAPVRPIELGNGSNRLSRGGSFMYTNSEARAQIDVPVEATYELSIEAWGTRAGDDLPRAVILIDRKRIASFDVAGTQGDEETHTTRVTLGSGTHQVSVRFVNDFYIEGEGDRNLAIENITLAGPVPEEPIARTEGYRQILAPAHGALTTSDEHGAASAVLERFATRAYRRPVAAQELAGLLAVFRSARGAGDTFDPALRVALSAVLVSPNFLYRSVDNTASDDPGTRYELSGYELASRLSYFLWSSMPDDALLASAAAGTLAHPDELIMQAKRMLQDPRSEALINNFTGQWLLLRNLDGMEIDPDRFSTFDESLKRDMENEARLCFADAVRGNRGILDLLDSDTTFLNERLAGHYGIPGVEGDAFRLVELPSESPRGGVLTMGAVLTVTSNPTRTSPVKRGLFVLDEILGTPPPPPPPDIPPLEQAAKQSGEHATLREQLQLHVSNPTCAACHRRMDPIGLAMENFDAIGRWRDTYSENQPIDASGSLPDGVIFNGPSELKDFLLSEPDRFLDNLTSKLLMYALGRGVEPFDRPTVHAISTRVREEGYNLQVLIEEIVRSEAFRTCRGKEGT